MSRPAALAAAALPACLLLALALRRAWRSARTHSLQAEQLRRAHDEARLCDERAVLLMLSRVEKAEEVLRQFYGQVVVDLSCVPDLARKTVYLCGDISRAHMFDLSKALRVLVVKELSQNHPSGLQWPIVSQGRLPLLIHGVGVYYRRFFDSDQNFFRRICSSHEFQTLTESTKPSNAHRTGIYLTTVERKGDDLSFHLLRCSSNLSGPTTNFSATDNHIVGALNQEADQIFEGQAPLNHVLAQIYMNTAAKGTQKQTKAKIKAHSDKTKDMPKNGIMAFCTYYDGLKSLRPLPNDEFDYGLHGISGLTKLHFRLKSQVAEQPGCNLTPHFSLTLYPDSVFFMPLSTNRLYTHEIRPGSLDASLLPIRMGYVVRCSKTLAVHKDGQTFLELDENKLVKLGAPTHDGMVKLRHWYAEENITDAVINYGDVLFSMNQGDYMKPIEHHADYHAEHPAKTAFQLVSLFTKNHFDELLGSVRFEDVAKGRQGTVLVMPDDYRGIPVVRTTTKYHRPAHCILRVHQHLMKLIEKSASISCAFNNVLMEKYTNAYASMGFHSDQALDLEPDSFIAVFSCYKFPHLAHPPPRKLVVQSKEAGGRMYEIPLEHNSAVIFSTHTNRHFKHKIVLDTSTQQPENPWIGLTFRKSGTFINFRGEQAFLRMATPSL